MFVIVLILKLWNKIEGSDLGIIIGSTVGCSLGYPEIAQYGIS